VTTKNIQRRIALNWPRVCCIHATVDGPSNGLAIGNRLSRTSSFGGVLGGDAAALDEHTLFADDVLPKGQRYCVAEHDVPVRE
jgi:hypothetical protein